MRTIWNGSINFGLVNIPVGLALATKPAARQSDVSFRTLHRECGTPIKQKRWCPVHDREVPNDELVKGWEVSKGEFVFVEDADLEADRPGVLRPDLLPGAVLDPGAAATVRSAAPRASGEWDGRARPLRPPRTGELRVDPGAR